MGNVGGRSGTICRWSTLLKQATFDVTSTSVKFLFLTVLPFLLRLSVFLYSFFISGSLCLSAHVLYHSLAVCPYFLLVLSVYSCQSDFPCLSFCLRLSFFQFMFVCLDVYLLD